MIQRHPNCQIRKCVICFEDHINLERELKRQCGSGNKYDMLSHYHKWLDNNKTPAETEFGWATQKAFDDKNIKMFCDWFKELKNEI